MKQTLVIGSTCAVVVIRVHALPARGGDALISAQELLLGGCAYNVSDTLRHFAIPHTLCSPVGSGMYGRFVAEQLQARHIPVFCRTERANGCCYCVVDASGERTFLCEHGAEYLFDRAAFDSVDLSGVDSAFFCGLELEEVTAGAEVAFLEDCKARGAGEFTVFFAPGPRICQLDNALLARIFALEPILHLNEEEACSVTRTDCAERAARSLYEKTHAPLVITLGGKGAYYLASDADKGVVPPCPAQVADTIGAGDSHFGAVIAGVKQGLPLRAAVTRANRLAAAVVGVHGSTLTQAEFDALHL